MVPWHCINCASVDYRWHCILREISTKPRGMLTHIDWSSLTAPGPYLMPTGLFCCPLSTRPLRHPSPTAFSEFLFPIPSLAFPGPLPVASRSRTQSFVWFRAKTNKKIVCLAHLFHSVTNVRTELMNGSFCWMANVGLSVCRSLLATVAYEFALNYLSVPGISCLSYLDGLWD